MNESEHQEFERLCDLFFEGEIGGDDKRRFESMLAQSEEARRVYVRQSGLRSSLRHYAAESQSSAEPEEHALRSAERKTIPFEILKWAASLILAFALGAAVWSGKTDTGSPDVAGAEFAEPTYEGMAVLIHAYDVVWPWGEAGYKSGDSIPAGRFRMASGLAQLEFYSGATVVIEGAADLDILSEDRAFCHRGRVSVSVSPHAKGFSIATPDIEFVDFGTEFGLEVAPGQSPRLHVFSGEVEVYEAGAGAGRERLHVLKTGDAAQFASAREAELIALDGSFRNARHLANLANRSERARFDAWKSMSEELSLRADAVSYFPFHKSPQWLRELANAAQDSPKEGNGAIVGCRWVNGRWAQKSALRFDNPSDRVRFNVPGEFEAVSFAAWIKVESLKNLYNGLFMTDTFDPGNPHWQIDNEGRLILGVKRKYETFQYVLFSEPVITPEVYGKWIHVASTYDVAASEIKHYLNGKLIGETREEGAADTTIVVGPGEIGNWGLSMETRRKIRNFNGSIDELLFCSSVLSAREIEEIYRRGESDANAATEILVAGSGSL